MELLIFCFQAARIGDGSLQKQIGVVFLLFRHNSRKHKIGPLRKARNKPGISVLDCRQHLPPELLLHIAAPLLLDIPMARHTTSLFKH